MSESKGKWLMFLVIALVILQVVTLGRLSDMRQEMNDLRNQVVNSNNDLRNSVSNISWNIQEQLEAGASIIDSYDYQLGALDTAALTMAVDFIVNPKEVAADTSATLEIEGQSYPMERQGDGFIARLEVDVFGSFRQPRVIFETLGLRRQETIDMGLDLRYDALPQLYASLDRDGGSTYHMAGEGGGGTYFLSGAVQINAVTKTGLGQQVRLFDLGLIAEADGREVWRLGSEDFPDSRTGGDNFFMDIEEAIEFPLQPGQTLRVYAQAEDEYGLLHQVTIDQITVDEQGEPTHDFDWFTGEETLLDKEGHILWQPEYD